MRLMGRTKKNRQVGLTKDGEIVPVNPCEAHAVCVHAARQEVDKSVVLTLMRTNASIIEVNVSSSASAMSPLPRNHELVHLQDWFDWFGRSAR